MSYSPSNPYASPQAPHPAAPAWPVAEMPVAPFRDLSAVGLFAQVMIGISLGVDLLVAASDANQINLLDRVINQLPVSQESASLAVVAAVLLSLGSFVVLIISAVAVLMWFHGAHKNLPSLRPSTKLAYSPGWAVGGFFVPFLNLVRPYQVMQEIWSRSDPKQLGTYKRLGSSLVGTWWGLWLAASIGGNVAMQMTIRGNLNPSRQGLIMQQMAMSCDVVRAFAHIGAGAVLFSIIRQVNLNQNKRYRLVLQQSQPVAQAAVPPGYSPYAGAPLPVAMPAYPAAPQPQPPPPLPPRPRPGSPPARRRPPQNPFA